MDQDKKERHGRLTVGADVLQSLFENGNSPLSEQFLRWKLWKKWTEYVGPTMGAICEPVGYNRGTLYIWVKNSSWMQQLIFMIEPLKTTINSKLGFNYVKSIHLTMDRRSVPKDSMQSDELKKSIEQLMSQGDE